MLVIVSVVFRFLNLRRQVGEPLVATRRRLIVIRQAALARRPICPSTVLGVRLALRKRDWRLSVILTSLLSEEHHVRRGHRGLCKT